MSTTGANRSLAHRFLVAALLLSAPLSSWAKTYSMPADFVNGGELQHLSAGVEGVTVERGVVPPEAYTYVAQPSEGVVVKVETQSGRQVARYHSNLLSKCAVCSKTASYWSPSRTSVDIEGNVWVANRAPGAWGSVTKIAANPAACIDRNGNGVIDTSRDVNGDGLVATSSDEFLGQNDECIVTTIPVGLSGFYLQAVAVDRDGNVWVGAYNAKTAYQIDPATGSIVRSVTVPVNPYGFTVRDNYLYVAGYSSGVARVDLATGAGVRKSCGVGWGLAVDSNGKAWFGGYYSGGILRVDFDAEDGCTRFDPASTTITGVAIDGEGQIWASAYTKKFVHKYDSSGNLLGKVATPGAAGHAIDVGHDGSIWVPGYSADIYRIESGAPGGPPGAVTKTSSGHPLRPAVSNDSYSDTTGFIVRNSSAQEGTWTAKQDSAKNGTLWGVVAWTAATPPGTSVRAEVRAADSPAALELAPFMTVANGQLFDGAGVRGRYLETKFTLRSTSTASPVLTFVDVEPTGLAVGAECSANSDCGSGYCVDGVCCNTSCDGQCQSCGESGSLGSCIAVAGAPRNGRASCATDGSACGGTCDGVDGDACSYPSAGVACRDSSCAAGVETHAAFCNGAGSCPTEQRDCDAYVCGENACATSCESLANCSAGNVCEASRCVADAAAPAIKIEPIAEFTNRDRISLSGSIVDAGGLASVELFVNGQPFEGFAVDSVGSFSTEVALSRDGSNTFEVRARDLAGNPSARLVETTLDTTNPAVTITAPSNGRAFGSSTVRVDATVTDTNPVTVLIAGQQFVPIAGKISADIQVPAEGTNSIVVAAVDSAGNSTQASVQVLIDFNQPVVTFEDLTEGKQYGRLVDDALVVTAHVDDLGATTATLTPGNSTLSFNPGGGVFAGAVTLVPGTNTITLTVTDAAGHVTTETRHVTYDIDPPEGTITCSVPWTEVQGVIDLSASVADDYTDVASVTFTVENLTAAATRGAVVFNTQLDTQPLSDGAHTLNATFVDGVGNARTLQQGILVDNTPPNVAITSHSDGETVHGDIHIVATGSDETSGVRSITLSVGGAVVATCEDAPSCETDFATGNLPNGNFVVSAVATDKANNETFLERTLVADNSAPVQTIQAPAVGAVVTTSPMTVEVNVTATDFRDVECFLDGASIGISTSTIAKWTNVSIASKLDGASTVQCRASDLAGNVTVSTADFTIRRWAFALSPDPFDLDVTSGTVRMKVTGENAGLLASVASQLTLSHDTAGGIAGATVGSDSTSAVTNLQFSRSALVEVLRTLNLPNGNTNLTLDLRLGNHEIGSDTFKVKP